MGRSLWDGRREVAAEAWPCQAETLPGIVRRCEPAPRASAAPGTWLSPCRLSLPRYCLTEVI